MSISESRSATGDGFASATFEGYHGRTARLTAMMTPERFQQIRMVFDSAVELEPEQRGLFLRKTRERDPKLACEVEELISAFDQRAGFMDRPIASLYGNPAADRISKPIREMNRPGAMAGAYTLLERIGEGGMGEVWRAEQRSPMRRVVAVKLIKAGMDTREVVARFESERQALALMDHPAIAKVFDAGSTSEGRPYFAMEYVDGAPITTYCDRRRLSVRERLALFIRACEGVQHAHQKAIIHRDLKPSNILVTEIDGKPVPKIIDFGIARAMSQSLTVETFLTRAGAILGTPDYMSPEQAFSGGEDIDTRSDIYSLGVILYQLLTGVLPFDFRRLPLDAALRMLREADAPHPSSRIRRVAGETDIADVRRTDPAALAGQIRGDLDAITLKALERDRSRRYGSPSDLAADIRRHLRSEPVAARPAGTVYKAGKYLNRHRAGVAVCAMLVLLLLSFGVAEAVQLRRIIRERDRADRIAAFMTAMFKVSNPSESRGNKVTAREILDKASKDVGPGLAKDPELQAQMMDVMGTVYFNLGLDAQAEPLLEKALDDRRRVLGPEHRITLQSMNELANVLDREGQSTRAKTMYQDCLAIRTRVLGPDDPDTLKSMSNWAHFLVETGRYGEAEKLYRDILERRIAQLGPEHPDTVSSMDNLGHTLENEGHLDQAETLARRALEIRRRVLGQDNPDTVHSMHHLVNVLYDEGHLRDAEKFAREMLSISTRVMGPEHPDTLNSMIALANTVEDQGRYVEAEKLDRQALDVQRRILGPDNPDTLLAMNNVAEVLAEEGRYEEAERMHREVLTSRTAILGPEHSHTLYSMSKLAWTLILMGRFDEAERLSRRAYEAQLRTLGAEHPETADSNYNLASIAAHEGVPDEAFARLRSAIDHGLKPSRMLGIEKDASLKPIRVDARFRPLVLYARRHALTTNPR